MSYNPSSRFFYYDNSLVGDMVLIKDDQKEHSNYMSKVYTKIGYVLPLIYGVLMTLVFIATFSA